MASLGIITANDQFLKYGILRYSVRREFIYVNLVRECLLELVITAYAGRERRLNGSGSGLMTDCVSSNPDDMDRWSQ